MRVQPYFLNAFLTFSVLAVSCSADHSQIDVEDQKVKVDLNELEDSLIISDSVDALDETSTVFLIDDFPKVWFKLTCDDGGDDCHIYHYCDAELQQIWIETEKGENYFLTVLYGQDSQQWKLENFSAEKKVMELYNVVEGSFDLITISGGENTTVDFMWNQDDSFCNFSGLFDEPFSYFVPEQDRANYEERAEDCTDFWE